MRTPTSASVSVLIAFITVSHSLPGQAAPPINVDTKNLLVQVDADNGRWSAQVKGTPMQLNDVHFLPGDDASGWTITSAVNNNDANIYGSFVTVTLQRDQARPTGLRVSGLRQQDRERYPGQPGPLEQHGQGGGYRGHGLLCVERRAAGRHGGQMGHAGHLFPQPRLLRVLGGD